MTPRPILIGGKGRLGFSVSTLRAAAAWGARVCLGLTSEEVSYINPERRRTPRVTNYKSRVTNYESPRARRKPCFFPELFPVPDAGSGVQEAVAELVGEHQDLAAMMRVVREHVREHRGAGGPRLRPAAPRKFCDAAFRRGRERGRGDRLRNGGRGRICSGYRRDCARRGSRTRFRRGVGVCKCSTYGSGTEILHDKSGRTSGAHFFAADLLRTKSAYCFSSFEIRRLTELPHDKYWAIFWRALLRRGSSSY